MPYAPGIQDISGQLTAQGINQAAQAYAQKVGSISNAVTGFMQTYQQNQMMTSQAMGKFQGALRSDPALQKYIQDAASDDPNTPKLSPELQKAIDNAKAGKVDLYDSAVLSNFVDTWATNRQQMAKSNLEAAQAARLTQETQAAQADRARQEQALLTMQNLSRGQGAGVYRSDVQQQMANNPFVRAQMQALQAGAPMSGGQLGQFVMNQQELAAKQAAGPQMTERERAVQTLRDAFVAKEGRSPDAQENADLLRQAARLGSAAYRPGQSLTDQAGNYIGNSTFNSETGKLMLAKPNGELAAIPEGARPATATAMTRDIINFETFKKLRNDVTQDEIAIGNLSKYLETQKDTSTGINRLADKISGGVKTLFNTGALSKEQFAQAYANQQLQGLLGANRLSVVGGGVLTEQDALRVIDRLGGNVDALQNPELVRQAIADMYSNKVRQYKDNVNFYNTAVENYWGTRNFAPAKPIEIDVGLLEAAARPPRLGLSDEKAARKRELEAKKAAGK